MLFRSNLPQPLATSTYHHHKPQPKIKTSIHIHPPPPSTSTTRSITPTTHDPIRTTILSNPLPSTHNPHWTHDPIGPTMHNPIIDPRPHRTHDPLPNHTNWTNKPPPCDPGTNQSTRERESGKEDRE